MKNDDFIKKSIDEEEELPESELGKVSAQAFDELENPVTETKKGGLPYTINEVEMPKGISDEKKTPRNGLKNLTIAAFLAVLFFALIGGLIVIRSMRQSEKVDVKNQSNSNTLNKTNDTMPDDVQQTIDAVKNQAAPNANTNTAIANTNPNNPTQTLANGSVMPSNGSVPLVGTPVYDVRMQPPPPENKIPVADSSKSAIGGGFNTASGNTPRQTEEKNEKVSVPVRSKVATDAVERNERVAYASGGRNEQGTLSFGSPTAASSRNGSLFIGQYKPSFGTVIPVRMLGALHTLQSGGLVRMELTRTIEGSNWRLSRGTIFVGRVAGGSDKRVFVSLIGYLDNRSNSLIELSGDILGRDGAIGVEGEKKRLQSRWKKVLGDALNKATQLGSAYLLGRKGGNGATGNNYSPESVYREATSETPYFVVVSAGANGYILVNDLPPTKELPASPLYQLPSAVSPSQPVIPNRGDITEEEIVKILSNGSPEEIRAAMPRMSPEWQELARRALSQVASR